jgi:hypothetical protein
MEPTVEKDEFGEVVPWDLYLRRNGAFLWSAKLYGRFPTWLQGMEIRLQSGTNWIKVDHMVGNGLERNEYLG